VFRSLHVPIEPRFRRRYREHYRETGTVYARRIRPAAARRRPRLLYLHGYMQPESYIEEFALLAGMARQLNVEVIQMQFPYHGRRTPRGARFSGELYWTADLVRSVEAWRQTLLDARTLLRYLRADDARPVGVAGLSLGGLLTLSLTCLEEHFAFSVPLIAHMDLGALVADAPVLGKMRRDLRSFGWSTQHFAAFVAGLGWDTLRPKLPLDRILLIAASHDRFFDPRVVTTMWKRWGKPAIRWWASLCTCRRRCARYARSSMSARLAAEGPYDPDGRGVRFTKHASRDTIPPMLARALTIAGSDSGGGAGIQADLKTFTVFGVYGMSAVTALTAQNTRGVTGIHTVPAAFVRAQIDAVVSDIGVDAAKTGMLVSAEIITTVAQAIRDYAITPLVVDPVMVAQSGAALLETTARAALLRELLPLATLTTPNVPEAEALTGIAIGSVADLRTAARRLIEQGTRACLVKGGHLGGDEAVDVFDDGRQVIELRAVRLQTAHTHGTGCQLSAAITAQLARGTPLLAAVEQAKRFITVAIRNGLALGTGAGPANPLAWPDAERPTGKM
jgi:hydroxymethylpyrimidine/phosphomethylpyrimidine kinase